jgi:hypothetical protein
MACRWPASRLPMACRSPAHGLPISCPWPADLLPIACPSAAHGLPIACRWPAGRRPMASSWPADGVPVACSWPAHDLPRGSGAHFVIWPFCHRLNLQNHWTFKLSNQSVKFQRTHVLFHQSNLPNLILTTTPHFSQKVLTNPGF